LNFPPVPAPVRPDVTGTGTQEPDASIGRRRWPGTLEGIDRGSEGQGKCCRDPQRTPHGKPECSSGLPLLV
ncbi:unnamed protein product, partial [Staurois parvus]